MTRYPTTNTAIHAPGAVRLLHQWQLSCTLVACRLGVIGHLPLSGAVLWQHHMGGVRQVQGAMLAAQLAFAKTLQVNKAAKDAISQHLYIWADCIHAFFDAVLLTK